MCRRKQKPAGPPERGSLKPTRNTQCLRNKEERQALRRKQPAAQGIGSPLSRFPSGESRGGRVPPTPRTLPASQPRRHASWLRLPPQEGFQNAPLNPPCAIPLPDSVCPP